MRGFEYKFYCEFTTHSRKTWLDLGYYKMNDEIGLFHSCQGSYSAKDYAKLYLREMVRMYSMPLSIILIVVSNSLSSFENLYKKALVLVLFLVRPFILKPTGKYNLLSKHCRICWEFAWLTSRVIEMIICLWLSFIITRAIIYVWTWLRMSLFMVGHVDSAYVCLKYVRFHW